MKRSTLVKLGLTLLLIGGIERFCQWQTGGFRIEKVRQDHIYPFSFAQRPPPPELHQTFTFLDSGVQGFAFLGEDQKTVLKLFKHYHGRISTDFLDRCMPRPLAKFLVQKREKRLGHILASAQMAHEKLPDMTGVFFTHLAKTAQHLGSITLIDHVGIAHTLPLDQVEFILQKKAELIENRLHALFEQNNREGAIEAMKTLLRLIETRSRQGIKNKDGKVLKNTGFIGAQAVEIDIGSFVVRGPSSHPGAHKKAARKAKRQLLTWIATHYPSELSPCTEALAHEAVE